MVRAISLLVSLGFFRSAEPECLYRDAILNDYLLP